MSQRELTMISDDVRQVLLRSISAAVRTVPPISRIPDQ
jgi:hypothetical protein